MSGGKFCGTVEELKRFLAIWYGYSILELFKASKVLKRQSVRPEVSYSVITNLDSALCELSRHESNLAQEVDRISFGYCVRRLHEPSLKLCAAIHLGETNIADHPATADFLKAVEDSEAFLPSTMAILERKLRIKDDGAPSMEAAGKGGGSAEKGKRKAGGQPKYDRKNDQRIADSVSQHGGNHKAAAKALGITLTDLERALARVRHHQKAARKRPAK